MHQNSIDGGVMRTTIEIPEDLLMKAMKAVHVRTKSAAIRMGLQSLVERQHVAELLKMRGNIRLDVNLRAARRR